SDNEGFLISAASTISSQTADIEEKIDRLQKAKNDLVSEQETCMNEVEQCRKPELFPLWDGEKGKGYDEKREEVYTIMESISENEGFLISAASTISSQTADIEEKIDRLQKAKNDLVSEQETCMNEVEQCRKPELFPLWDGEKGKGYDEKREEVYTIMESIYEN